VARLWLVASLAVGVVVPCRAWHIAGADFWYEYLGSNAAATTDAYRINLKLYRDCSRDGQQGVADFDNVITLFVFLGDNGGLATTFTVTAPPFRPRLNPTAAGQCGAQVQNICLEEGTYQAVVSLPRRAGGYHVAWSRCCRNEGVKNVANSNAAGITYLTFIPGPEVALQNSSPVFVERPPIFICANELFLFDHSATDPDGDSLAYSVSWPYDGLNAAGFGTSQDIPVVGATGSIFNPMGAPPYVNVGYNPGYTFEQPFGAGGTFSINARNGELRVRSTQLGLFVVAVSVREYRGGVLIAEHRRDMQLVVVPCRPQGAPPQITRLTPGLVVSGDTIILQARKQSCFTLTITDVDTVDRLDIRLDAPGLSPAPVLTPVSNPATVNNPFSWQVCWTPACPPPGGALYTLEVRARDRADCPSHNWALNTTFIRVVPPPQGSPVVNINLAGLPTSGDTIRLPVGAQGCFPFEVLPNPPDQQAGYSILFEQIPLPVPTFTDDGATTGLLRGTICWTAGCGNLSTPGLIRIVGFNANACPPLRTTERRVWVQATLPPNPPPDIAVRNVTLPELNDTVVLTVDAPGCFPFRLRDTLPAGLGLSVRAWVELPDGTREPPASLTFTQPFSEQTDTSLAGEVCYTPTCAAANRRVRLIVEGRETVACDSGYRVRDTLYLLVRNLPNPRPRLLLQYQSLPRNGDTLLLNVDTRQCIPFRVIDSLPMGRLTYRPLLEDALTGEVLAPTPTLSGITQAELTPPGLVFQDGTLCIVGPCGPPDRLVRLRLRVLDSTRCAGSHELEETLLVRVIVPPNPRPRLGIELPPELITDADTIVLEARTGLCFERIALDTLPASRLSWELAIEQVAGNRTLTYPFADRTTLHPGQGAPPIDTLRSTVCWTAPCDEINQTLRFVITLRDSANCALDWLLRDTLYIRVVPPPVAPLRLNLTTAPFETTPSGVVVYAKRPNCFRIDFADPNGGLLNVEVRAEPPLPLTLSQTQGQDSLTAWVCLSPTCAAEDQTFRLFITARSQPDCKPLLRAAVDTPIVVRSYPALTPIVDWEVPAEAQVFANGLNDGTLRAGERLCARFVITGADTVSAIVYQTISETFRAGFGFGSEAAITELTALERNPLRVEACFTPNCYLAGQRYALLMCARDTLPCRAQPQACDSVVFTIDDCVLDLPNVFTPNGDGVNDTFGPLPNRGVERYELNIFDRWGTLLHRSLASQPWDGTHNGSPALEGVYFYDLTYRFFSGTGKPLGLRKTGPLTLIK
jgi:gliding motility-associated-like protein